MAFRTSHIGYFILLGFVGCINKPSTTAFNLKKGKPESRVEFFHYGGYGDTVYAMIYAQVYEPASTPDGKNSLKPLAGVTLRVEQGGKAAYSDNLGNIQIGLQKGIYNLLLSKDGYQQVKLLNYVSDPDQISTTKMILVKGDGFTTFEIPARGKQ